MRASPSEELPVFKKRLRVDACPAKKVVGSQKKEGSFFEEPSVEVTNYLSRRVSPRCETTK